MRRDGMCVGEKRDRRKMNDLILGNKGSLGVLKFEGIAYKKEGLDW